MKTRDFRPRQPAQRSRRAAPDLQRPAENRLFRDGCCNTSEEDSGSHTVCVVVTAEFLEFSREQCNDLSTPHPQFGFP